MQKRHFFTIRTVLFIISCAAVFLLSILSACDTPGTRGCGDGENSNTGSSIKDVTPLIPDPSWDCTMPAGIPTPDKGQIVFEAQLTLGEIHDMGQTPYGRRHLIEIAGGKVSGPFIKAEVLTGGLDFQLTLSNGVMEIDQINILKTSDNKHIYFRSCGTAVDQSDVRIVPDFEAPDSSAYSFLNSGKFAGTRELDMDSKTMKIKVYDVSDVAMDTRAAGAVRVTQPDDVPDQSWECREAGSSERKGDVLYTETVNIGSSIAVGNSKNGFRNIIPITGGTAAGKISGKVLFGGADYQIISAGAFSIDARYTIETNDGELIIVRNCGPAASLVPVFETRVDGSHGYLNNSLWLSSSPGIGSAESVVLTIYESK